LRNFIEVHVGAGSSSASDTISFDLYGDSFGLQVDFCNSPTFDDVTINDDLTVTDDIDCNGHVDCYNVVELGSTGTEIKSGTATTAGLFFTILKPVNINVQVVSFSGSANAVTLVLKSNGFLYNVESVVDGVTTTTGTGAESSVPYFLMPGYYNLKTNADTASVKVICNGVYGAASITAAEIIS
jgi:hypothetical protein